MRSRLRAWEKSKMAIKKKVHRSMGSIDMVIFPRSDRPHTTSGIAAEISIAQEKIKSYLHFAAYSHRCRTKRLSATQVFPVDLKVLIGGGRQLCEKLL